jgi:hypothetical protein
VIFKPDLKNCRPYLGGRFKGCEPKKVEFGFEKLTETSLSYIQAMPVLASVSFNLFCPSWPERESVDLKAGKTEVTLSASSLPKVSKIEVSIPYSQLNQEVVAFTPKIGRETTVEKNCLMETVSITSIPSKDFLSIVSESLAGSYKEILDFKTKVEEAQELPAKFSALDLGIKNLDSAINTLNIEKNSFEKELDSIPEESLEEREETTAIIENLSSVISDLVSTKSDVEAIRPIGDKCKLSNGSAVEAECLVKLDAIVRGLASSLSDKNEIVKKFNGFIDGEIARLNSTSDRLSRELQKLRIQTN